MDADLHSNANLLRHYRQQKANKDLQHPGQPNALVAKRNAIAFAYGNGQTDCITAHPAQAARACCGS
jgi:hypothetical protein